MNKYDNILVTGGCGFIGTNFIKYVLNKTNYNGNIINVDALTYSGNKLNLQDIYNRFGEKRYFFYKVDISDKLKIKNVFDKHNIDCIIHFAAETHVDRSIEKPAGFIKTNIVGTYNLLEIAKEKWGEGGSSNKRFHHISTDEVYGSLGHDGYFYENTCYDPRSPYSASKASSDHLVKSFFHTFGLPVTISNCSNNYGPYQFPKKLIPLMILNMLNGKALPVYGKGENVRDWLFVEDHCSAVWKIVNEVSLTELI
ncbi:MAG TPA: dTDP-glucose 4,6-dehydratase, partial [Flexistipes sinusarabici]|nr:dTDP-glucose 4,6-dehydratase [Flexistipes sinusarabici]